MKKTDRKIPDAMLPEYRFDYRRARANRFASRLRDQVVTVVLQPDVAQVFNSSEVVNRFLRSVISAVPARRERTASRKSRRKAG
jgi:hypothetical protein